MSVASRGAMGGLLFSGYGNFAPVLCVSMILRYFGIKSGVKMKLKNVKRLEFFFFKSREMLKYVTKMLKK